MKQLIPFFTLAVVALLAPACSESASTNEAVVSAPANSALPIATTSAPTADGTAPAVNYPPKHQAEAESLESTSVEFEGEVFDFGEVPEGTKVSHQFKFKNTGANPLRITRVKASCGCTTPSYSQDPIAPGEEGFIDVAFDSSGKPGFQNKSVTVTGNFADGVNKILKIKGQVKPQAE